MPPCHVHGFFTAAGYDERGRPWPAGLVPGLPYAGTLIFTSEAPQGIQNYDVYHSPSSVAMGPLSQTYEFMGKVQELYASLSPPSEEFFMRCRREVLMDGRSRDVRHLCGFGFAVHQFWTIDNEHGGVDMYVQSIGEMPDTVVRYALGVAEASQWWRARTYTFVGTEVLQSWMVAGRRPLE